MDIWLCVLWIWTGLFLCSVLHHPVKIGNTCTCAQICPAHEMKSHPSMHAPNKIVQKQIENLHETWSITPYKPEFNPYLWEIYCSLSKIVKDCECLKQNNAGTVIIFQSLQTRHQKTSVAEGVHIAMSIQKSKYPTWVPC